VELSRFAGVSEAGARRPNPERSEGSEYSFLLISPLQKC
jgi:hypothetical protein